MEISYLPPPKKSFWLMAKWKINLGEGFWCVRGQGSCFDMASAAKRPQRAKSEWSRKEKLLFGHIVAICRDKKGAGCIVEPFCFRGGSGRGEKFDLGANGGKTKKTLKFLEELYAFQVGPGRKSLAFRPREQRKSRKMSENETRANFWSFVTNFSAS